jgi:copper resistance protein C
VKRSLPNFLISEVFRVGIGVAVALTLLLATRAASAHAVLVQSSPAINATVQGPDVPVTFKFSSRVDGARSTLTLSAPDGQSRSLAIEQQGSPDTLTAHATHLLPGQYAIQWQVLATDGHVTRGQIQFHVK